MPAAETGQFDGQKATRFAHESPSLYAGFVGFYYRKSVSMGPFRVNLSKSGIGYSMGGRGFRTGLSGSGRRYTSFNVPGTGFGYRTSGSRAGCMVFLFATGAAIAGAGFWIAGRIT
jgi:Protein of unknown function (DUF4236)